jgi:hypothetical protein
MRPTSRPYQPADELARAVRSELGTAIAAIDALYGAPVEADHVDRLLSAEFRCARLEARLSVLTGPARIGRSLVDLRRLVAELTNEVDDEATRRGAAIDLACMGPSVDLWLDPVLFAELMRCALDALVTSLDRRTHASVQLSTDAGYTIIELPSVLGGVNRRVFAHLADHLDLGFREANGSLRLVVPHAELEVDRDEFGYPRRRWIFPPPTAA